MNLKGTKVLVTGAGGFIGSHLCEALLVRGAQVTALVHYNALGSWGNLELLPQISRQSLNVVLGNVEDSSQMLRILKGQECVFHLAALIGIPYSYVAPQSVVRTNIEGTLNILEAARERDVRRVIHTSTSETYGTAIYSPIDENHPLQAQSPYAASKVGADKIAMSYCLSFGLPVSIVRPFNTYGPRQSSRAVIPTIVSQALTQNQITLGDTTPVRDLTFVGDTVEAFIKVAENDGAIGKTLNVGTGSGITVNDLCQKIQKILGNEKPVTMSQERTRPEKSEVWKLIANAESLSEITGWKAMTQLEEGLRRTIDFISENLQRFKPTSYQV